MPLLDTPAYRPPVYLRQKDLHTVVSALTRKPKVTYNRFRMELEDGDFIDLDFASTNTGQRPIMVITHGLEGDSGSQYMKGTTRVMEQAGYDAVCFNLRSCSGEPNRIYPSYHSGKSDDLELVIDHLIQDLGYREIYLSGFSLGGNLSLKYVGERTDNIRSEIKGLVAISVPCDLESCCQNLHRRRNWVYLKNFIRTLRQKAITKKEMFPEEAEFSMEQARGIRNFHDFDSLYTAPAHGFRDALDYYHTCASNNFLAGLRIPTLLINALDDPFLTPQCFPFEAAKHNDYLHFMTPKYGGHVGFIAHWRMQGNTWVEDRMVEFLGRI